MTISNTKITRRGVQVTLGLLWLLDGALQLQHQMFTSSFATQVIGPAAQGQPRLVSGIMHFSIRIFLLHPAVFNSFIAIIQLGLGILILWKRSVKLGLLLSVIWGLFVWYVGEGAGGVFSAHTLILMGAPGAALLYAILALGVLPSDAKRKSRGNAEIPAYWLGIVWAVLWIGGAVYQLLPGQNSVSDVSGMILGSANGAPHWLYAIDTHVASAINSFGTTTTSMAGLHMTAAQMAQMQTQPSSGYWFIALLSLAQLFIGLAIFMPRVLRKLAVICGILLSLTFWIIGQSLGGYYTGLATDPSTAPLFILLGLSVLACTRLDVKVSNIFRKLEKVLT